MAEKNEVIYWAANEAEAVVVIARLEEAGIQAIRVRESYGSMNALSLRSQHTDRELLCFLREQGQWGQRQGRRDVQSGQKRADRGQLHLLRELGRRGIKTILPYIISFAENATTLISIAGKAILLILLAAAIEAYFV